LVFESDSVGYFSDLLAAVIYQFSTGGRLTEWARSAQPNGHRILADGTHVVADGAERAVLRFDASGRRLAPITRSDDSTLVVPNDLTLDDAGGFYFTDAPAGTIHYVDESGAATTVARGLEGPNGIAVHPGGDWLYVGESGPRRISRFLIESPGSLGAGEVLAFIAEPAYPDSIVATIDGMTFDEDGNLYVAYIGDGRIHVIDPVGNTIRRLDAGQISVSNVAFGGPGLHFLYTVGGRDAWTVTAYRALESPGPGVLARLDLTPVTGFSDRARWRRER
jgi:gluconolactonase